MQDLVDELKKLIPFKDTTLTGDVVLVAGDNPRMIVYALVDKIEPDMSRSDQWWHVTMKVLSVPPRETVWTLREAQFTGKEIFTMGGDKRFMQAIRLDSVSSPAEPEERKTNKTSPGTSPFRRVK